MRNAQHSGADRLSVFGAGRAVRSSCVKGIWRDILNGEYIMRVVPRITVFFRPGLLFSPGFLFALIFQENSI